MIQLQLKAVKSSSNSAVSPNLCKKKKKMNFEEEKAIPMKNEGSMMGKVENNHVK